MEYDHNEDDDDSDSVIDNGDIDDDNDVEYKPSMDIIKEVDKEDEVAEQEMLDEAPTEDTEGTEAQTEGSTNTEAKTEGIEGTEAQTEGTTCMEIDSLDQVIMAAALVEKAEAQSGTIQLGQIQLNLPDDNVTDGQIVMLTSMDDTSGVTTSTTAVSDGTIMDTGNRKVKMTGDERNNRRFSCGVCKNRFKELAVLKTHMLTHSNKREFACMYQGCNYAFKTKGSLKRHMRRHTGERPYPCELCGRNFSESGALTRHLKSRVPCSSKTDDDLPRYKKTWSTDPNIPAAVGKLSHDIQDNNNSNNVPVVQNIQVVSVHSVQGIKTTDNQDTQCITDLHTNNVLNNVIHDSQDKHLFDGELCEGTEVVIDDNIKTITNDDGTLTTDDSIQDFVHTETVSQADYNTCKVCQEEFLSQEALKTHLRTHLAGDTCKCHLCHYITDTKIDFENHMFLHHNVQIRSSDPLSELDIPRDDRSYIKFNDIMDECKKAQVALKQLMDIPAETSNIETNNDIASGSLYKCPVCNKQFRRSNYLRFHMRNHTGLRPHRCFKCNRAFITRDTLKKHMATHVDDRSFKCGECGKLFKRLSHVREHVKIHSAVRPFVCSICDKSFKTNNAMKVHLRTHTNILPYECSFCHRRFREKGSVVRHMRMHTGEKPFECRFCGRKFAEHGTLNRHLKAKVSCQRQSVMMKDFTDDEETDYSVLAEFSSVVADTQQYIVPESGEEEFDDKQSTTQHDTVPYQSTEIVVVQSNDRDEAEENVQVKDIEVLTNEDGTLATVETLQVTDDYIVITDTSNNCMRVLDSKSGETVAIVPMTDSTDADKVQTITIPQEGDVSTVTMVPESEVGEMVTITQLIDNGEDSLHEVMEQTGGFEVEVMETEQNNDDNNVIVVEDGKINDATS
ncbi:Transcription factor [Mactra antiquata]